MKLMLKGVQTAADAVLAVKAGVDGIVCSNHGGRQQDTARSGLEVLGEVMPALRKTFTSERLVRHVYVIQQITLPYCNHNSYRHLAGSLYGAV